MRFPLLFKILRPCPLLPGLLLAAVCLQSCAKVGPYLDRLKQSLDRETAVEEQTLVRAVPIPPEEIPPPPAPVPMEPLVNKEARVSILGYHDFSESVSTNDMILNITDFRRQMQAIKDSGLPVISMRQYLDWKQGRKPIPDQCVMITIDDGWKATHTLALQVLREYGYPFTVFLYKNYIGIGGKSLTHEEIREIAANGGTISSHSVSHQNMAKRAGRSDEDYKAWLRVELEESYRFLEENFADTGALEKTFAFPYGIYSDQILAMTKELGYEAAFTVNGKKTDWDTPDMEIGRYVVHGTTLANFEAALNFGGGPGVSTVGRQLMAESTNAAGDVEAPLVSVRPEADSVIGNRLPLIEVDFSRLENLDPASISLRVGGLSKVPHTFDPATSMLSYQVPQRLRRSRCHVEVSFAKIGAKESEVIAWSFALDRVADYLSSEETAPGKNDPLQPKEVITPAEAAPVGASPVETVPVEAASAGASTSPGTL